MERFNIAEFERNQSDDEYIFTAKDGRHVVQRKLAEREEYSEESAMPNSYYSKVKVFYMDSGNIKINGEQFYKMTINTWSYYEHSGTLIRQVDWEAKFRFGLNDLIAKMKADYKVDMMAKGNRVYAERSLEIDPKPFYSISFPVGPAKPAAMFTVIIDGNNGKELEKRTNIIKH